MQKTGLSQIQSRIKLHHVILLISFIGALYLASPLFKEGTPVNQDLSLHYARFWCFKQQNLPLAVSWCPNFDAGTPFFRGYPILPFQIASFLSLIFGMNLAFKLMLLIIYLVTPIGAYLLLKQLGRPLAGSIASAFLIFEHGGWHSGGFDQTFIVGIFANSLATGMLLVCLAFMVRFFQNPDWQNSVYLGISLALLIMSHTSPLGLFLLIFAILLVLQPKFLKEHYMKLGFIFAISVAISAYWFIPLFLQHSQGYYNEVTGGLWFDKDLYQNFFYRPINKPMFWLGIVGVVFLLAFRPKEWKYLAVTYLIVPVLFLMGYFVPALYLATPIPKLISLVRISANLRTFLAISAAFLIASLPHIKIAGESKQTKTILSLSAAVLAILVLYTSIPITMQSSKFIFTSNRQEFQWQAELYKQIGNPNARVLPQELYNKVGGVFGITHFESYYPIITGAEVFTYNGISFKENYGEWGERELLTGAYDNPAIDEKNLTQFFQRTNLKYVLLVDTRMKAIMIGYVSNYTKSAVLAETGPYTLYDTGIEPSYFEVTSGNAQLSDVNYNGRSASLTVSATAPSRILLKVHDYPNWIVTVNKQRANKINPPGHLLEIELPAGNHKVEYKYLMIPLDYASFAITFAAIGICALVLYRTKKKSHERASHEPNEDASQIKGSDADSETLPENPADET